MSQPPPEVSPAEPGGKPRGFWKQVAFTRARRHYEVPHAILRPGHTQEDIDSYVAGLTSIAKEKIRAIRLETPPAPSNLSPAQQVAWRESQMLRQARAALDRAPPAFPSVMFIVAWWPLANGVRVKLGHSIVLPIPFGARLLDGEWREVGAACDTTYFLAAAGPERPPLADAILLEAALQAAEEAVRPAGVGPTDKGLELYGSWLIGLPERIRPDMMFEWNGAMAAFVTEPPSKLVPCGAMFRDVRLSSIQAIDGMISALEGGLPKSPSPGTPERRRRRRRPDQGVRGLPLLEADGQGRILVNGTGTEINLSTGPGTLLEAILKKMQRTLSRNADRSELQAALHDATQGALGVARGEDAAGLRHLTGPVAIGPHLAQRLGIGTQYWP